MVCVGACIPGAVVPLVLLPLVLLPLVLHTSVVTPPILKSSLMIFNCFAMFFAPAAAQAQIKEIYAGRQRGDTQAPRDESR
jgi:hypothetical protein